jgi:hypothetical protein
MFSSMSFKIRWWSEIDRLLFELLVVMETFLELIEVVWRRDRRLSYFHTGLFIGRVYPRFPKKGRAADPPA